MGVDLYCIPGLGVDERLFKNVHPEGVNMKHIKWLSPEKNEALSSYAMRLAEQIDRTRPFALMGVSFGGMCCAEIAKQLNPVKTFIVSSCKLSGELPRKITFWKQFALYKLLSDKRYVQVAMLVRRQFGVRRGEQTTRFIEMLKAAPPKYFSGAVHCIMLWENEQIPESIVHIHGSKDSVLPLRKIIRCDHVIDGGTHYMIVDKADEISAIISSYL